jgi:hypothetical protein
LRGLVPFRRLAGPGLVPDIFHNLPAP